jgi:hypothetical protein
VNESAAGAANGQTIVNYSFRRAYETNAFHQFPLLTPWELRSQGRERGIQPSFSSTFEKRA